MYAIPGAALTEHQTITQAARRVPHGVICLLSALRFHDLTTQAPFEVWMAIDVKARSPKEEIIPLRIVRFSGQALTAGVETHTIEGVKVNGERTTWTIEAGKVGNEKPIVITRDVWTSPDLMVTMQTRDADPQVGETTYRLTNLKRGEPDASLMRVPPDFTVIKAPITPVVPHAPVAPASPKAPSAPGAKG